MSVRRWGQGPEPALLLHCTLAQGGAWAGFARHMLHRLTMIAPDLLAHGEGPDHDPAQDFHDQATEEAAKHLPESPCHLIGHSFGATLALRIALDHPEQVKTLTLIEPVLFCAANGPGRAAHDALVAPVPAALARGDTVTAAEIFLDLWGAASLAQTPDRQRDYILQRMWIPAACAPALEEDRTHILPRLPALRVPTLLLQGAESPPVIAEILVRLSTDIENAQTVVIPNAAHMAPMTRPGAVAAAIERFLDTV